MYLITCALLLTTFLNVGQGQTLGDTQNILTTILSGYSSDVRPANNQSLPVQVNVTMDLVNIKEFDEVSEQLTVVFILYLTWVDIRLTWNPLEFNGSKYINIPVTKIWRPNLILTTPIGKIIPVGSGQDWAVVRCFYDGSIMWNAADFITSWCDVDVSLFPFDKQFCSLSFIPWGYQTKEVLLTSVEDKVRQTFFTENGAWILDDSLVITENVSEGHFSRYSVTLGLKRRSVFFLVNAVIPVIFISCLTMLVFFIPVECGERVSYAITVFLALAVFMTIVSDNLPKNSKDMAKLCYFLLMNVGHSTVVCFETILCLVTYYREGPVPKWVARSLFLKPCGEQKEGIKAMHKAKAVDHGKEIDISCEKLATITIPDLERKISWRDVSHKLDKLFGLGAIIVLITFAITFVIVVSGN